MQLFNILFHFLFFIFYILFHFIYLHYENVAQHTIKATTTTSIKRLRHAALRTALTARTSERKREREKEE